VSLQLSRYDIRLLEIFLLGRYYLWLLGSLLLGYFLLVGVIQSLNKGLLSV
jgi:hypothetical protein